MRILTPWLLVALGGLGAPPPQAQPVLEEAAQRFALAWARGDGGALEGMMRKEGVRLHLLGEEHRSIPPRQARAALEDFRRRYPNGDPELLRATLAEGDSSRGLADLRLPARAPGGGEAVIFTLFVGFSLEEGGWVVTEVRVLT